MMDFLGLIMKLPITAFVYSIDMFAKTLQGMQKLADQSIDAMLGRRIQAPGDSECGLTSDAIASGIAQNLGSPPGSQSDLTSTRTTSLTNSTDRESAETPDKEARNMRDTDLSDHTMLKLVRYKILFIKRKFEVAFQEREELIADDMTEPSYCTWKIAEFIQDLAERKTKIPSQWGEKYPPCEKQYREGNILLGFPESDKKFLRVYFEVLDRYQREKLHKDERQIEVLEEIRDRLRTSS